MEGKEMFSSIEVAEMLSVSSQTVRNLVKTRRLTGIMVGNSLRIPAVELRAYLLKRTIKAN